MNFLSTENQILLEDLHSIAYDISVSWSAFNDKTVLITGATGLIGGLLVKAILYANLAHNNQTKIIAVVRDKFRASKMFSPYTNCHELKFYEADIAKEIEIDEEIDYIIHCASITQSKLFVETPLDVIKTTLWGSDNLLKLARRKNTASMVYLSSMEVYGTFNDKEKISEDDLGYINPLAARSSYSESKRATETLCYAYFKQYGLPVKIARLTQTFGPGVSHDDSRVFAQFCRNAMQGLDIVLHTLGETKRDYLYSADAVTALLIMLLKGESGQAYNVANPATYITIRDMAELVARNCAVEPVRVVVDIPDNLSKMGYAPTVKLNLDTSKIESLGWQAKTDLPKMYRRLILFLQQDQTNQRMQSLRFGNNFFKDRAS